jgi:hypothetical protein
LCGNGALSAFFVYHDPDDLDIVRQVDLFQHFFAVRHLRNGFGRNKADRIDVFEPRVNQGAQVTGFDLRRNLTAEALPRVAWAFD